MRVVQSGGSSRLKGFLLAFSSLTVVGGSGAMAAEGVDSEVTEVVVTATKTERNLSDVPASMSVVHGKELARRPVQDMAEALEDEPGVVIGGIGMSRRGIIIRGMAPEYALTLIDGRRINAASSNMAHVDFDLGWVPSVAIDRIELVRGPLSALYGSEALSGVVNIITRKPGPVWQTRFDAMTGFREGEGGDTQQYGLYTGGPINDKVAVSLWGDYHKRDITASEEDPRQSELESRDSYSGTAQLHLTPTDRQRVDIGVTYGEDERGRDTLTTSGTIFSYRYMDKVRRQSGFVTYNGQFGFGDIEARLYRTELRRVNARDKGQTPTPSSDLVDTVADVRYTLPAIGVHRLTTGAEWRREELKDATVSTSGEKETEHKALFVQDEINLFTDRLEIVAGTRFDHHDAYGWETSPRLYIVYKPSEHWTVRGGIGHAFRAPGLKQLSPTYAAIAAGGRFTIYGNPDLKPETNDSAELGLAWRNEMADASVTLFRNEVGNLVTSYCLTNCGIRGRETRTYTNVNEARLEGVETAFGLRPVEGLSLMASYTYVDSLDKATDRPIAERPQRTGKIGLDLQATPRLSVGVRGRFIGEQLTSTYVRLPGYSLWGTNVSYDLNEHVTLRAGVDNLFKARLAEKSTLYSFAEPGRVVFVGLSGRF
ncbi:TonB-dependent receptor [Asticcacaulis sp. SL142]|uniref:TonB-dependent receptor domain-containing protein n=1 Tax=Asticcacaulis sp. SL142 TaxID=2995155 RepID=UPI00226D1FCA|nr:TonB-dependent receptor [Asticcacaulis sp. SL142]WAC48248.1 TonB-dependent receptor [Asticcacaulis sp. SL142]